MTMSARLLIGPAWHWGPFLARRGQLMIIRFGMASCFGKGSTTPFLAAPVRALDRLR